MMKKENKTKNRVLAAWQCKRIENAEKEPCLKSHNSFWAGDKYVGRRFDPPVNNKPSYQKQREQLFSSFLKTRLSLIQYPENCDLTRKLNPENPLSQLTKTAQASVKMLSMKARRLDYKSPSDFSVLFLNVHGDDLAVLTGWSSRQMSYYLCSH